MAEESTGHRWVRHTRGYEQRAAAPDAANAATVTEPPEPAMAAGDLPSGDPGKDDHPKISFAMIVFWASVVAVPASSALVTAVLSRQVGPGELSVITAVFVLTLVGAVVPIAVQAEVAASRVATGRLHDLPWRGLIIGTTATAIAGAALAPLLELPPLAVFFGIMQVLPGVAVGLSRGEMIADRDFGHAAANQLAEAVMRLFFGIALGLAFGATGVAASFLLAMIGAWAVITRRSTDDHARSVLALPATLAALALFTLSVHLDLLVSRRILGPLADDFSVAALPAKGVFLLLVAAGWVVIPYARSRHTARQLVVPVALTSGAGVVLAICAAVGAPILATVLGKPAPDRGIVLLLGLAMAAASGTWVGLQVLLTRASPRLWVPAISAIGVYLALAVYTSTLAGFAIAACIGQGAALAVTVHRLRKLAVEEPELDADLAEARFTSPLIEHAQHESRVRENLGAIVDRKVLAAVSAGFVVLSLLQRPGTIVSETKLDVAVDPGVFLGRIWHLWEPVADLGRVQDQAVGYLFPMGPFFLITKMLNVPEWVSIRLWMGLLIAVAFWGAARLADELKLGVPATRVIAAVSYALSPMVIARVGNTSGIMIGLAFLPWIVLPLVRASKSGSVRKAAAYSGVAILCTGGVNGAITLAVLVVPAMFLVTRRAGPRRRALMGWWLVACALATFWWFVPLIFQAKYGFNFLPFTERAATTTAFASPVEALRGTGDWLSYLNLQEPWLPAGWWLVASPVVIVATALIAGAGLYGLARRDMGERVWLVLTVVIGVGLVTMGYAASHTALPDAMLGNPFGSIVRTMLDGAAGMFRNVWKFQPVIALPLALGTAHAVSVARLKLASKNQAWRPAVAIGAIGVITLSALPLLRGDLVTDKGWQATPDYWTEFAHFHEQHTGNGRLLVIPGATTADYNWGRSLDEPLQTSTNVPWAVRSIIPLGGAGSSMVLDTTERIIRRGGDPALSSFLARAGFSYVVVRNDLDWKTWNAPRPAQVGAALAASGFVKETSFGPNLTPADTDPFGVGDAERKMKALEVYKVDPAGAAKRTGNASLAAEPAHGLVTSYAADSTMSVSGSPAAVASLQRDGMLRNDPVVLAGDESVSPGFKATPRSQVITDTYRNEWSDHGLVGDNESYTLADGEKVAGEREASVQLSTSKQAPKTYAVQENISGVTASSYGSWLYQLPEAAPANVLDGDPSTSWVAGPARTSQGEWLDIKLDAATAIDHLDVSMLADGPWRPTVRELLVTTDTGTLTVPVQPGEQAQRVPLPAGNTTNVRLTFTKIEGETPTSAGVGIREVAIPGMSTARRLVVPTATSTQAGSKPAGSSIPTAFVFERDVVDPRDLLRKDAEHLLRREFQAPASQQVTFSGTARPVPGSALFALVDRKGDLEVTSSSTYQDYPDYRPANVLDGNGRTLWIARPPEPAQQTTAGFPGQDTQKGNGATRRTAPMEQLTDPAPSITLAWAEPREISELKLGLAPAFSSPTGVLVENQRGETRAATVGKDGNVRFDPIEATKIEINFAQIAWRTTTAADGSSVKAPLALTDISVPVLDDLLPGTNSPGTKVSVPCEEGPTATIDGQVTHFSIDTTVGDLIGLQPAKLTACTTDTELSAGRHDLDTAIGNAPFNIDTLAVGPPSMLRPDAASSTTMAAPAVRGVEWSPERRTVDVGAGGDSVLVVSENYTNGWKATLNGQDLQPVQIDGWRQGFVVPATNGGTVELTFLPTGAYRLALLVGLAFVLMLLFLALFPARVDRSLVAFDELSPRPLQSTAAVVVLVAAAVWIGGLAGLLLCPLVLVVHRRAREHAPAIAMAGMVVAGVCVALSPGSNPVDGVGAFGWPGQLLAVGALLVVAGSLLAGAQPRRSQPQQVIDLREPKPEAEPSFAFPVQEEVTVGIRRVPEMLSELADGAYLFANGADEGTRTAGSSRWASRWVAPLARARVAVVGGVRSLRRFVDERRGAIDGVPFGPAGASSSRASSAAAPAVLFRDGEPEKNAPRRRTLKRQGGHRS